MTFDNETNYILIRVVRDGLRGPDVRRVLARLPFEQPRLRAVLRQRQCVPAACAGLGLGGARGPRRVHQPPRRLDQAGERDQGDCELSDTH